MSVYLLKRKHGVALNRVHTLIFLMHSIVGVLHWLKAIASTRSDIRNK